MEAKYEQSVIADWLPVGERLVQGLTTSFSLPIMLVIDDETKSSGPQ